MTITPGSMELPEETEARWTADAEGAEHAQRDEDVALAHCDHVWITDDHGDAPGSVTYCDACGLQA